MDIKKFVCNPFQENTYIVSDETKECVIIDCGAFFAEERKAILEYIRNNRLTPRHLLSTHAHIDHNFGTDTIYGEFGLKPEIHINDKILAGKLHEQAKTFCGIDINYDFPEPGVWLCDKDMITFGNHSFRILSTPGHTPGSVFYHCAEEGIAFSGDTLFNMSIGRTDFELGSYDDIIESLRHISSALPPDTVIYPGHGPKTSMDTETTYNPYLKL
nr:MBL fold metallo-hydrolase [Xylanibacter muris]